MKVKIYKETLKNKKIIFDSLKTYCSFNKPQIKIIPFSNEQFDYSSGNFGIIFIGEFNDKQNKKEIIIKVGIDSSIDHEITLCKTFTSYYIDSFSFFDSTLNQTLKCIICKRFNMSLTNLHLYSPSNETLKNLWKQCCISLKNLHKIKIIHRDITPNNIVCNIMYQNTIHEKVEAMIIDYNVSTINIDLGVYSCGVGTKCYSSAQYLKSKIYYYKDDLEMLCFAFWHTIQPNHTFFNLCNSNMKVSISSKLDLESIHDIPLKLKDVII